jgi:hypothetical protein
VPASEADVLHLASSPQQAEPSSAKDEQETPGLWQSLTEKHAKLTPFAAEPPDAVNFRTEDGEQFDAPAKADWATICQAGEANGMNPMAALRAIGQFGTFKGMRQRASFTRDM